MTSYRNKLERWQAKMAEQHARQQEARKARVKRGQRRRYLIRRRKRQPPADLQRAARIEAERKQMASDPDRGARLVIAMLWRVVLRQHAREQAETAAVLAAVPREEREAWQWLSDPDWTGPTPLPVSVWPSLIAAAPEVD